MSRPGLRDLVLCILVLLSVLSGRRALAQDNCPNPAGGDCFTPTPGIPGCQNENCCVSICFQDPFCCDNEWDDNCAGAALTDPACNPFSQCGAGAGDCFSANGTPGCEDIECCVTICTQDPFCCDVQWDTACANLANSLCVESCTVQCPGGATPEAEQCGQRLNDGCNDDPAVFEPIECGQSICGELFAFEGRDTDWFEYVPAEDTLVKWTVSSDLPTIASILSSPCEELNTLANAFSSECQAATAEACVPGGVPVYLFVAPGTEDGGIFAGFPCGSERNEYAATLQCTPCDIKTPPNDDCANAETVSEGDTPFDTAFATTDGPEHPLCDLTGDDQISRDIWFNFTATQDGLLRVSTCNAADFDTKIAVYDGCGACDPEVLETAIIACSDNKPGCVGFTTDMLVPVSNGACYTIRLGGAQGEGGAGTLTLEYEPICELDCPGAGQIYNEIEACGEDSNGGCNSPAQFFENIQPGDIICGTAWASLGSRDTDWYLIDVPDDDGDTEAAILLTLTSQFPMQASVLDVTDCQNIIELSAAVVSDDCTPGATLGGCVDAPGQYAVFVAPGDGANGVFHDYPCGTPAGNRYILDVEVLDDCSSLKIENDSCIDAIPITNGDTEFTNANADTDGMLHMPDCVDQFGSSQITGDIWYTYLAPCTGTLTVSTCDQANFNTKIAVYDTCDPLDCPPGDAALIGCNDLGEGCTNFTSRLDVPVIQGECYKIRVGGSVNSQGSGTITISCASENCPADLSGDNMVGPPDLAIILGNWGPVPPNDPIADLNMDGVVGPADLAIILGNWGPC